MDDAIAITLERVAGTARGVTRFDMQATAMAPRVRGIGSGHLIGTRATF